MPPTPVLPLPAAMGVAEIRPLPPRPPAQALALGCTLVTDDEREFSRVDGLRIENWLRG